MNSSHKDDRIIELDVLLIEDDPDDTLIIREKLSETVLTSCHVKYVPCLSMGIDWLKKKKFDAVLLDLMLPDSKGLETLMTIKCYARQIPIVVLTGFENSEMGRSSIKQGAQDFISKKDMNANMLENSLLFSIERNQLMVQLEKRKKELVESELRIRHIIEKNADGIIIIDRNNELRFMNPAAEVLIGRTSDGSAGFTNAISRLTGAMRQYAGISMDSFELNIAQENEVPIIMEIRVKEIDWKGEPAFLGSLRDITDRKLLERNLLIEKERLDITLRSIADGVITTDKGGKILSLNSAAVRITGLKLTQVVGQPIRTFLCMPELPWETLVDQPVTDACYTAIYKNDMILEYSCAPILDKENNVDGYAFIIRDITLRKKLAEETIKIQKLESLGVVAGSLAHEYNNVLAEIMSNIYITKNYVKENAEAYKALEKAEQSSSKAKDLTVQLNNFSRCNDTNHTNDHILLLLREITGDLTEKTYPQCDIRWEMDENLWSAIFDRNQVYSALWNIIENACESMPNGGTVEIKINNVVISEKKYLPIKSGNYIKITVTDQGEGMDKEKLTRIFDPFFTTKENSPGMGLPTAFSIIRKHGGTIEVDSIPGMGSSFSIFLPSSDACDRIK